VVRLRRRIGGALCDGLAPSRHAVSCAGDVPGLVHAHRGADPPGGASAKWPTRLRSALGALYSIWAALIVMLGAWLGSEIGERPVRILSSGGSPFAGSLAAASGFFQLYHTPLPPVWLSCSSRAALCSESSVSRQFCNYLGAALLSVAFLHSRNVLGNGCCLLMALLMATGMALSGPAPPGATMGISLIFIPLLLRRDSPGGAGKVLRVAAFAGRGVLPWSRC